MNSECIDEPNALGYCCICAQGYDGNPYLKKGCQGHHGALMRFVNLWFNVHNALLHLQTSMSVNLHHLSTLATVHAATRLEATTVHAHKELRVTTQRQQLPLTCSNTIGSYNCSCPQGTQSDDPKTAACTFIPDGLNQTEPEVVIGIFSPTAFARILLVSLITLNYYNTYLDRVDRPHHLYICSSDLLSEKKANERKVENGGQILYQKILSQQVDTVTIFTIEDLKTATNNFDKSRELGTWGHGTVYKGVLRNGKLVAVKRSKVMNLSETDEFVQEIIILSQINHKNVAAALKWKYLYWCMNSSQTALSST
ncbi:hypothetical protein EJB05_55000, partial [Eragrostis curvula]